MRKELIVERRRNRRWETGLWGNPFGRRFFADSGASDGGGTTGATTAAVDGTAAASAVSADATPSFLSQVCDDKGVLKDGWTTHFKDQIGDGNKYFDNFKAGKNTIHDVMKSMTGLSKLAGRALIPASDASDEEWGKVFEAAGGVPKTVEDYGLTLEENPNNPFPPGFKELVEKSGFLEKVGKELLASKTPMRFAGAHASARLEAALQRYNEAISSREKAGKEVLAPVLGKTPVEEAIKGAREALARLCDHTDQTPSPVFKAFTELLTDSGLIDHPTVVAMLHTIATRMNPGKAIVRGTPVTAGGGRVTGPGVTPGTDYVSAMAPLTLAQITRGK